MDSGVHFGFHAPTHSDQIAPAANELT